MSMISRIKNGGDWKYRLLKIPAAFFDFLVALFTLGYCFGDATYRVCEWQMRRQLQNTKEL